VERLKGKKKTMRARDVTAVGLIVSLLAIASCGGQVGHAAATTELVGAQLVPLAAAPAIGTGFPQQFPNYSGPPCTIANDCSLVSHPNLNTDFPPPACTEYTGECLAVGSVMRCALHLKSGLECLAGSVALCTTSGADEGVITCDATCHWPATGCQRCGHKVPTEPCCMNAKCYGGTPLCAKDTTGVSSTGVCR